MSPPMVIPNSFRH
jgi:hypothetical protein